MSVWLSDDDLAKTAPAETLPLATPIPTQVVSNGEYLPWPQTAAQRRVEDELRDLADANGRRLRLDRRQFLRTASGLAAAFLAMNRVFGPFFAVTPAEAADPDAARERSTALARQFVFDVQTHFVRDDYAWNGILELGEYAKRWNPVLRDEGVTMRRFKLENYLKEIFLDSQTTLALVSSAPSDDPANTILSSEQMARTRALVNAVAGTRRLFCHGVIRPGHPGWLDDLAETAERLRPDSWKGYSVGDPLAPSKWPWRMDDERVVYPGYERIAKSGIRIVCVHKGLVPPDYERTFPNWQFARVDDVGKAARDWPQLTFVIYHSALKPFLTSPDESLAQFDRTGRMDWVSDLADVRETHGVTNVYAELGTSFASSVVTHPRHCAAMLGILVKGLGADHVLWGTDSVWYGSPQWQIEAFRRIEIPQELQTARGFAPLGPADGALKRAILGGNAARLYGLDLRAAFAPEALASDGIATVRAAYEAAGPARSNLAYGLVRARIEGGDVAGRFDGRVVLATGVASGIGRATALAFAREGARLVLGDVAPAGEETARAARALGVEAEFAVTDVARQADVDALVARAITRHGRLDGAVNNAGIEGLLHPTAEYPEEVFARVIQVNLMGVWRCLRAEIPAMLASGGGAIVNTASVAGLVGAGGLSPYVASKHAVVGLTRAAAIEYATSGIRVNAVCPGVIDTPMVDRLSRQMPNLREVLLAMKPMGRLGQPDEVADAIVWLCSEAASFVTGHALAVDGGYVAQ